MPYIKKDFRSKYDNAILQVIDFCQDGDDLVSCQKFVLFGVDLLDYILDKDIFLESELSLSLRDHLNLGTVDRANQLAEVISNLLPDNLKDLAGELNYVLSKIVWGIIDDATDKPAGYFKRCFIRGALQHQIAEVIRDPGYNSDATTLLLSVIDDVRAEMYRRRMVPYEDKKIEENGDIWVS